MQNKPENSNENLMFLDDEIAYALAGFPPAYRGTVIALMRRAFRCGEDSTREESKLS